MIAAYQNGWMTGLALMVISLDLLRCAWGQTSAAGAISTWLPHRLAGAALLLGLHLSLPTPHPIWGLVLLSLAGLAHVWDSLAQRVARWP